MGARTLGDPFGTEEAGADGFMSKRDCAEGRLLAEVARVIAKHKGES